MARPEGHLDAGHALAILALQVACLSWTVGSLYAQNVGRRLPLAALDCGHSALPLCP